jgi:hypothetical protein
MVRHEPTSSAKMGGMRFSEEQRRHISRQAVGRFVEVLEYVEPVPGETGCAAGDYWVMRFDDGSEISFRFMAELVR